MIKFLVRICLALSLTLAGASSWADLDSPTYKSAREAYARSDWADALELLKQFMAEDSSFLSANPTANQAITEAVSYCERMTRRGTSNLIAGGVRFFPAPPPELP